ncbi:MAG: tRNA lysidine(34) synthetase TilS [Clostridia bacterium]|nr:tRNA lysidine(34) synthetase TilS [Clostridia bacterium]
MKNILKAIEDDRLLKAGDVVGVGVSGGSDSMALLHFLHDHSQELDIEVVAIHVDHSIREESEDDADFVARYCRQNGIRHYKFKINVPKLAEDRKENLEKVARDARFGVFDSLLKKAVVDKIAIAHNMRDQAETILHNLFRGTGVEGGSGMKTKRAEVYIRPLLNTSKKEILDYCFLNDVPYVEDKTNGDNTYSRNFIRNVLMPQIEERWPSFVEKLVNFGKDCADDSKYINTQIFDDAIIYNEKTAKIPNSYFLYDNAIVSRIIFKALNKIGVVQDIERVHVQMLKELALNGENGSKIKLPMNVTAFREYDHLTLTNKKKEEIVLNQPFKSGSFYVEGFGTVTVKRTKDLSRAKGEILFDGKKIPKDAVWRFKERGDIFEKFGGGGTKKLKDYLIDKKIPLRIRSILPVLASGKNILAIAGVEIADSIKIDENTTSVVKVSIS